MRKVYPILLSLILGFLPAYANEDEKKKDAEMIKLLESKIDLSKPENRGEQTFSYLLDENGKRLADLTGMEPGEFSEGFAKFGIEKKIKAGGIPMPSFGEKQVGFIDINGNKVIPAKFSQCGKFSEGLAWFVDESGNAGYIDKTGKEIFKVGDSYRAGDFSDGLAFFLTLVPNKAEGAWQSKIPDKCGFLDKTGKKVIEAKYDFTKGFSNGLAAVKLNQKWFFIDKNGNQVGDIYDKVQSFSESLGAVRVNSKWGYINPAGKLVIPFTFDDAQNFSEGLAAVKVGNLTGFIDKTGKMVIEPQFEDVFPFTQGLAGVKSTSKLWGFIDKSGKIVIEPSFDEIDIFSCSRAKVKKGLQYGFIDPQGKYVIKPEYIFAYPFADSRAIVAEKNWNHPIMRGMLMGVHLEGLKIHKDSTSRSGVYVPISFEDALKELDDILPVAAKRDIQIIDKGEMIHYHHGFGTWLRNNWCLWSGGALSKDMQRLGFTHPDDMSGTILDSYWLKVHGKPISLKTQAEHYKKYWDGMQNSKKDLNKIPTKKLPPPK